MQSVQYFRPILYLLWDRVAFRSAFPIVKIFFHGEKSNNNNKEVLDQKHTNLYNIPHFLFLTLICFHVMVVVVN